MWETNLYHALVSIEFMQHNCKDTQIDVSICSGTQMMFFLEIRSVVTSVHCRVHAGACHIRVCAAN
jgi:hypothetical protein